MTGSFRGVVAVLLGVALTVAACGDDGPGLVDQAERSAQPPMVPAVEPTGVVISVFALDNSFRSLLTEISIGDEVLWENRGLNEHNVRSIVVDDWGADAEDFQPGDVFSHVFTEPGEFPYFCSIHGNETVGMVGTIIVSA